MHINQLLIMEVITMSKMFNELIDALKGTIASHIRHSEKANIAKKKLEASIRNMANIPETVDMTSETAKNSVNEILQMDSFLSKPMTELCKTYNNISAEGMEDETEIYKMKALYTILAWIDEMDTVFAEASLFNGNENAIDCQNELWSMFNEGHNITYAQVLKQMEEDEEEASKTSDGIEITDPEEEELLKKVSKFTGDCRQVKIDWLTNKGIPDYRYFVSANGKITSYINLELHEVFPRKKRTYKNHEESEEIIINLSPTKTFKVANLVLEAFNPYLRTVKYSVEYLDGNSRNCELANLLPHVEG